MYIAIFLYNIYKFMYGREKNIYNYSINALNINHIVTPNYRNLDIVNIFDMFYVYIYNV